MRHRPIGLLVWAVILLASATAAIAVDGVIEINQSSALAGGVSSGDQQGFPVTLSDPGSYRLTSGLTATAGFGGIVVTADNVTLDLNGFSVISPGGGNFSDGISLGSRQNVEIRNGTIRGFARAGIFTNNSTHYIRVIGVHAIGNAINAIDLQGNGNFVDGCIVGNSNNGIRVFDGSLVINSVARGIAFRGLNVGDTSGYRSNVLTGNNGGDANPQVSSTGFQLGGNVCGTDTVCP